MTEPSAPKPRITTEGSPYVTLTAAEQFARAMDYRPDEIETARRDLTELMLTAYRTEGGAVRLRNKGRGIDATARVVVEPPLLVVVSIDVRDLSVSGGARKREARELVARGGEGPAAQHQRRRIVR